MTKASIAMKPKLKIPVSSRTANQVLLSSCDVLSRAPIQATSPVIRPPITPTPPTMPSPRRDQASALGRTSTTSLPEVMKTLPTKARDTAAMMRIAPAATAIRPAMKTRVTVDFDMVCSLSSDWCGCEQVSERVRS